MDTTVEPPRQSGRSVQRGTPTLYRGIRFRSRTEARWACFFDAVGWPWLYEPTDLEWYIPDFLLPFPAGPLLVEVKAAVDLQDLAEHRRKICQSGWPREAMLVGVGPFELGAAQPIAGLMAEREPGPDGDLGWVWGEGRLFTCLSCGALSVLAAHGSWWCRVCGDGDGNEHVGSVPTTLPATWAQATNRTQWRAG